MFSFFNPNTWVTEEREFRIYGDDHASVWSVVDEIDYQWCIQWLWSPKYSKGDKKFYLRRSIQTGVGQYTRTQHTRFLHTEIMERTGILPPSPLHILVDHRDGNSMNCRRANLRWATHSMNNKNVNGKYAHDLIEEC